MMREEWQKFHILPDPITFQVQLAKEQRRREIAFGILIIVFATGLLIKRFL
jgi:hypothetical protein